MTAKKTTPKPPMKGPKRPDKARAPDWPLIRLEYVNSFITYADLARKHGIRESTVVQQGNRHKWEAERRTVSAKVMAKAQSELEAERVARLKTINENHLRVANDLLTQVASALTKAAEEDESIPAKDVRALASAAEAVQRISRLALGATTDNHGLSNPDGGPVATSAILPTTEERYLAARARVLNKY